VDHLFLSRNHIFVSYDEQSYFGSWANEVESNILSVFSRDGHLEFGLRELFGKERFADDLFEISAAYTYADHIVFIGFESGFVWNLDVLQRTWKKVPFPFEEVGIEALSGDDKKAYAIFDHRWARDRYPDRSPFELAVFDLAENGRSEGAICQSKDK